MPTPVAQPICDLLQIMPCDPADAGTLLGGISAAVALAIGLVVVPMTYIQVRAAQLLQAESFVRQSVNDYRRMAADHPQAWALRRRGERQSEAMLLEGERGARARASFEALVEAFDANERFLGESNYRTYLRSELRRYLDSLKSIYDDDDFVETSASGRAALEKLLHESWSRIPSEAKSAERDIENYNARVNANERIGVAITQEAQLGFGASDEARGSVALYEQHVAKLEELARLRFVFALFGLSPATAPP